MTISWSSSLMRGTSSRRSKWTFRLFAPSSAPPPRAAAHHSKRRRRCSPLRVTTACPDTTRPLHLRRHYAATATAVPAAAVAAALAPTSLAAAARPRGRHLDRLGPRVRSARCRLDTIAARLVASDPSPQVPSRTRPPPSGPEGWCLPSAWSRARGALYVYLFTVKREKN